MSASFYSQVELLVPPTAAKHLVRLEDLLALAESRFHVPARAAEDANLDGTYNSGVLTATAVGALTVDGVALAASDRVLLFGQTDQT